MQKVCFSCHYAATERYCPLPLKSKKKCTSENRICDCSPALSKDEKGEICVNQGYCHSCRKKLVAIGTARTNGAQHHGDWRKRKYHKKCWREMIDDLQHRAMVWNLKQQVFFVLGGPNIGCCLSPILFDRLLCMFYSVCIQHQCLTRQLHCVKEGKRVFAQNNQLFLSIVHQFLLHCRRQHLLMCTCHDTPSHALTLTRPSLSHCR